MTRATRQHGLTLIELLAVIAILSLVAGVATVGLASSGAAASLHAAESGWKELDARARLLARAEGAMVMSIDDDARVVRLHVAATGERVGVVPLGALEAALETAGADDAVRFDGLGRSVDYHARLTGAERGRRWRVAGLTGAIREVGP
jgi:prepilin-type N-terminal cleavage/methylation domain-containing protein